MTCIWQHKNWPRFTWHSDLLLTPLGKVRFNQGSLIAQIRELGFDIQQTARADVLVEEALKTSAIEGEELDPAAVRSSVGRQLGIPDAGLRHGQDRKADGLVEILLDATGNHDRNMTLARLFAWHAALFPTGYSGMTQINVARWRDDKNGPMKVVSGPAGNKKVHFEAPPAHVINFEMEAFISWVNRPPETDGIIKAALSSHSLLERIMMKARFWKTFAQTPLNDRQVKVINRLLDAGPNGFDGGLKNKKYMGITHTSRATAQRELADLVQKKILMRLPGGGRSASYDLVWKKFEK
jgi:Fic family protein